MIQSKIFYGAGKLQERINSFLRTNNNYIKDVITITQTQSESTVITIVLYKTELGYIDSIVDEK